MAIYPVCMEPHPALRITARPVDEITQDIRRLARDMIETMYAHDGIGLAAPQIGRDMQLVVANPTQQPGRELVVVNPAIDEVRGRAGIVEGCLSLPEVWERVRRAAKVHLSGQDLDGRPLSIHADGLLAIVLQHEVDHLQGRLFIDRLSWLHRYRLHHRHRRLHLTAPASHAPSSCA